MPVSYEERQRRRERTVEVERMVNRILPLRRRFHDGSIERLRRQRVPLRIRMEREQLQRDREAREQWGCTSAELFQYSCLNMANNFELHPPRIPTARELARERLRQQLTEQLRERDERFAAAQAEEIERLRRNALLRQIARAEDQLYEWRQRRPVVHQRLITFVETWLALDKNATLAWLEHFRKANFVSNHDIRHWDIVAWYTKGVPDEVYTAVERVQEYYHEEARLIGKIQDLSVELGDERRDEDEERLMLNDLQWHLITGHIFGAGTANLTNGFSQICTRKTGAERIDFICHALDVRMLMIEHKMHDGGHAEKAALPGTIQRMRIFICSAYSDLYKACVAYHAAGATDAALGRAYETTQKKLNAAREVLDQQFRTLLAWLEEQEEKAAASAEADEDEDERDFLSDDDE